MNDLVRNFKFKRGQVWINDQDYKVQIIDIGTDSLWLKYVENGWVGSWEIRKFLDNYTIWEDV